MKLKTLAKFYISAAIILTLVTIFLSILPSYQDSYDDGKEIMTKLSHAGSGAIGVGIIAAACFFMAGQLVIEYSRQNKI